MVYSLPKGSKMLEIKSRVKKARILLPLYLVPVQAWITAANICLAAP
jgi:hypothetical protein